MGGRIAILISLAACAAPSDEPETVYDPCSPLHVAISPSATAGERSGVEGAIAAWAARLPTQLAMQEGGGDGRALAIVFDPDAGQRGAYWDASGYISINDAMLAESELPFAIAHEMGHAFGLAHVPTSERASVMNIGNTSVAPTEEDAAHVAALWPSCNP